MLLHTNKNTEYFKRNTLKLVLLCYSQKELTQGHLAKAMMCDLMSGV